MTLQGKKEIINERWVKYLQFEREELKRIARSITNLDDLIVRNYLSEIIETFIDWGIKATSDKQKKVIDELLLKAITLQSYDNVKDERIKYLTFENEQIEKTYLETLKENSILKENIKELEEKLSKMLEN